MSFFATVALSVVHRPRLESEGAYAAIQLIVSNFDDTGDILEQLCKLTANLMVASTLESSPDDVLGVVDIMRNHPDHLGIQKEVRSACCVPQTP